MLDMYLLLDTYVGYVSSGLRFYQPALSLTSPILYFIYAFWLLIYRASTRLMGAVLSYACCLVTHIQRVCFDGNCVAALVNCIQSEYMRDGSCIAILSDIGLVQYVWCLIHGK